MKKKLTRHKSCLGFVPKKVRLIMRLTLFMLLVFMLQVRANSYCQSVKVSLEFEEISLEKVLKEINRQTSLDFFYSKKYLDVDRKVSLHFKNERLDKVLLEILGKDLKVEYKNDYILIIPKEKSSQQVKEVVVKGKVVDEKGIPLPGVTILVKGSSTGVSSDIKGAFVLSVPKAKDIILLFSFMGMKTQEVKVVDGKPLNIVLKENKQELKEIVVTGYFNRDKDSFTGSATAISQEELARVGTSNIIQAIRTFDPSFKIAENVLDGSNPNSMPKIRVRGESGFGVNELDAERMMSRGESRNDPNMPIFILDGFETSIEKIYDLDKARVKSMTLLKDAASCAIYGSRGANGIVVIETVPPEDGKLKVSYNFEGRINMPDLSDYDLCNAEEKLELEERAALYYYPTSPLMQNDLNKQYNQRLELVLSGVDTDWKAKAVENTLSHKHSLYAEGGSESLRYGLSVKYDNTKGVMKGSGRDKFSLGFDFRYNNRDKIRFKNSISVDYVKGTDSPYGSFKDFVEINPYFSPYDEKGNLIKVLGTVGAYKYNDVMNPLYRGTSGSYRKNYYASIVNNFSFEYLLTEAFRLKTVVSIEGRLAKDDNFISPDEIRYSEHQYQVGEGMFAKGELFSQYKTLFRYNTYVSLNYSKTFGLHTVQLNCTGQLSQDSEDAFSTTVEGFGNSVLNHISLARQYQRQAGYDFAAPGGYEEKSRELSSFGALHYVYDNRYMCDLSYTIDASSKFGKDDRIASFWSAGIGWNLHNESFCENVSRIDKLKLRSNIGETGKLNFSPYQALTMYKFSNSDSYSQDISAYLMGYGNSNLTWETTLSKDFGVDLEMFDKRLSFSGTYYIKTTDNLVTDLTVAPSNGVLSYKENVGAIENKGYELMLKLGVFRSSDFNINVSGSLSHNRNKILNISNSLKEYNDRVSELQDKEQENEVDYPFRALQKLDYASKPMLRYSEGASMTAIYAVKSSGINPANGKEIFLRQDGTMTDEWSSTEVVVVGDTEPDAYGTLSLSVNYKNWELYSDFIYSVGGQVYNQTLVDRVENANARVNTDRRVFEERWSKPGDLSKYKNVVDKTQTRASSRFVQDYDYLQMTSLTCSYTISKDNLKNIGLDRLKLMVSMQDLFRISTVKQERGINYPFARSIAFSVQAKF